MSRYVEIIVIVEGKTEQIFIEKILAPYLGNRNIGIYATQVSKPGQKGGDVRFDRVKKDIKNHLLQRSDTYVTTFVDYYGIVQWPGKEQITSTDTSTIISQKLHNAAKREFFKQYSNFRKDRFIPFIAMHEFEALLFSDPEILAIELGVDKNKVLEIITNYKNPEEINNSQHTAPSKRLDCLMTSGKFSKTTMGIIIAEKIGISKIREKCPIFNLWLAELEALVEV
jgi:hypothetical protein